MRTRDLTPTGHLLVVLDSGEEVLGALAALACDRGLPTASFTAIGVLSDARIGYLDPTSGSYDVLEVAEPTEVLALSGSIVWGDDAPGVHAHVALGTSAGAGLGGHLLAGHVHPTLEVFVEVYAERVSRTYDDATGQELIAP